MLRACALGLKGVGQVQKISEERVTLLARAIGSAGIPDINGFGPNPVVLRMTHSKTGCTFASLILHLQDLAIRRFCGIENPCP